MWKKEEASYELKALEQERRLSDLNWESECHENYQPADVLRELLRNGKRPAKECEEALNAEGYDLTKLNAGRIRKKAGADSKKFAGDNFYSWYLCSTSSYFFLPYLEPGVWCRTVSVPFIPFE
jgi:hypothetical protein